MRFTLSLVGALAALSLGAPLLAQEAQHRFWDAAIAGDTLAIREAVDDGARIDSLDTRRNPNGRRALNWAALNDRVAAIELLLALGAPLEAENNTGFSALHHAAEAGSIAAARALLAAGADPSHANKAGSSPAQTARELGNVEVAALLEVAERERQAPQQ
jgi:ankyrin repeat protein